MVGSHLNSPRTHLVEQAMDGPARFVLTSPNGKSVEGMQAMDKELMHALARRAGLDKALAEFPDDVAAAADQAASVTARIKVPEDPRAEPWPAMRPGDGL
jgi:hypothetical protein